MANHVKFILPRNVKLDAYVCGTYTHRGPNFFHVVRGQLNGIIQEKDRENASGQLTFSHDILTEFYPYKMIDGGKCYERFYEINGSESRNDALVVRAENMKSCANCDKKVCDFVNCPEVLVQSIWEFVKNNQRPR